MKTFTLVVTLVAMSIGSFAQTPAEQLKGVWVSQSTFCEEGKITVTGVEPNGVVRGEFSCKRTGWKPVMGDKISKDAIKTTLTGTRFVMENQDGGGWDLTLQGNTLQGTGAATRGRSWNRSTYIKQ